jgi:hypothetical protein
LQIEQMQEQQVLEIYPDLVHDTAGLRTPGARNPANFIQERENRFQSPANLPGDCQRRSESGAFAPDPFPQCPVRCFPFIVAIAPGRDRIEVYRCHNHQHRKVCLKIQNVRDKKVTNSCRKRDIEISA